MDMKKIPMLVESENGHDTKEIPENEVKEAVKKEIENDRWVYVEKEDGKTEIVANLEDLEWAEKFQNVKSITSTKKVVGG
jgi:hypothetical protein